MRVFFSDRDYQIYLGILVEQVRRFDLGIWAYCLMPNHVHLIAVPAAADHLARALGETHRKYSCYINQREEWTGHLWQERFSSFPLDESHLLFAVRYVLLNPVRAGLVNQAEDWHHSSIKAHLSGIADDLVDPGPMSERIESWESYLEVPETNETLEILRMHSRTGRPLGDDGFIDRVERLSARTLRPWIRRS